MNLFVRIVILMLPVLSFAFPGAAEELPRFDFRKAEIAAPWKAGHDLASITATAEGLKLIASGSDPFIMGPTAAFPEKQPLLAHFRLRAAAGGQCQLFYFDAKQGPSEPQSVRFHVPGGRAAEITIPLPALFARTRFRFDFAGGDELLWERLEFTERPEYRVDDWGTPSGEEPRDPLVLRQDEVELRVARDRFGSFDLRFENHSLARGNDRAWIGYAKENRLQRLEFAAGETRATRSDGTIEIETRIEDREGATWRVRQTWRGDGQRTFAVRTVLTVSQDRDLVFAPLLLLHAGLGSFGAEKSQGLLAGVEYLENEPSSSEADLTLPAALRRVPDDVKLTFPLAAISAEGRTLALDWTMSPEIAVLFDSPDRLFRSQSHVMGLIAPGSNGTSRIDGEPLPFASMRLAAGKELVAEARVRCGRGRSVVPAIREYVTRHELPPHPAQRTLAEYLDLTAQAWLDSPIRKESHFTHALMGDQFKHHAAPDAAWHVQRLATLSSSRSKELASLAAKAIEATPPGVRSAGKIGHVAYPVAPLVFGGIEPSMEHARALAKNISARFDAAGKLRYQAAKDRADYARTHTSDQANGFTAQAIDQLLEHACFAGDQALIDRGLELLRGLHVWDDSVPRGAQTWEIPLHTPDILASAYLVRAFVRGYELTGDERYLVAARHWAWTGVPFVYLRQPAEGPIGPYASIAVLGATNWEAPVWIGLPVQWCGAVYADAIRRLAPYDREAPWIKLADGIALSGAEQLYGAGHRHVGLLPDSFSLRAQSRNPADINPATLQAIALQAYGLPAMYRFHVFREEKLLLHAPGEVKLGEKKPNAIAFRLEGWSPDRYEILMHGFAKEPRFRVNGEEQSFGEQHRFIVPTGSAVIQLTGAADLEFVLP